MSESKRISNLYQSIYNGNPWLEVTLADTLAEITANQAYLIQWRRTILSRVQGEVVNAPDHNYFVPVLDSSEAAWEQSLQSLAKSQELWNAFFENFDDADFAKIYANNGHTYYEHLHGIIQHDVYHLGQIVILKKLL
jgi:uncharacterized damage-inducible protein DinB